MGIAVNLARKVRSDKLDRLTGAPSKQLRHWWLRSRHCGARPRPWTVQHAWAFAISRAAALRGLSRETQGAVYSFLAGLSPRVIEQRAAEHRLCLAILNGQLMPYLAGRDAWTSDYARSITSQATAAGIEVALVVIDAQPLLEQLVSAQEAQP